MKKFKLLLIIIALYSVSLTASAQRLLAEERAQALLGYTNKYHAYCCREVRIAIWRQF